jgi:glucoamylase
LRPALIGQWTQTGIKQSFQCGDVWYLLERPIGSRLYRLHLKTNLKHAAALDVSLTCPGLPELGPWESSAAGPEPSPEPSFNPRNGQLRFSVALPAKSTECIWTWG